MSRLLSLFWSMILLASAGLLSTQASAQQSANAMNIADVELRGPFEEITTRDPFYGVLEVQGSLHANERRRLQVPLAVRGPEALGEPFEGLEPLRFVAWREARADAEWDSLPFALRLRARPVLQAERPAPRAAALCVLLAGGVLLIATRRRPALAGGLTPLLVAGIIVAQTTGTGQPARSVRVIEVDGSGASVLVECSLDEMRMRAEDAGLRLECEPASILPEWGVELRSSATPIWTARAAGASLTHFRPHRIESNLLSPATNNWGPIREVHLRSSAGAWSRGGAWDAGEALPELDSVLPPPPAWLVGNLPQGVPVLIVLADSDLWGEPHWGDLRSERRPTWLRAIGLDWGE